MIPIDLIQTTIVKSDETIIPDSETETLGTTELMQWE